MSSYHKSVLLKDSVDALQINPDGVYVDVTFGGGGHSKEILNRLGDGGMLYAFDQDADAAQNSIDDDRFVLVPHNFMYISRFLKFYGVHKVDGILADLGVSSHQFDQADRGFSTRFDGILDMRMDQASDLSAFKVVNEYSEKELADVLFQYGELRNARAMASKIIQSREEHKIKTTSDLKDVLAAFLPQAKSHKILAQIFQAIRIEVNQEMEVLKKFLEQVPGLLNDGGILSVISYHSLEDRLVKRFIKNGCFEGEPQKDFFGRVELPLKQVGKLIAPKDSEIKENNRARSAKLRVAKRNG